MEGEWTSAVPDDVLRTLPRTDAALADPRLAAAVDRLGRSLVKAVVAAVQERARAGEFPPSEINDRALAAQPDTASALRPVINATGVLLHTNLGRAPLSAAARDAALAAGGATDLELDLDSGRRSRRGLSAVDALLRLVPPAEAAQIVNNGAAALVLVATALAKGREIVVSRGELVEIGDGFRLPDLLVCTGARLREVGTTNRTGLADYAAAVGPATGFVLKIHPSNFRITGFTRAAGVAELARLAVPVVADIGSGLLAPEPALPDEPDATTWLRDGASLVTASGDKLLGGPQCGLMLGRADLVEQLARHPLARAMRVDKLTLAALEATLRGPATPVHRALHAKPGRLRERAERLAGELRGHGLDCRAVDCEAVIGGGGAPGVTLQSAAVSLPASFAAPLRRGRPGVRGWGGGGRCVVALGAVPAVADPAL
ncbi:L-seryl-tRNA(Sec) selenium transferase, partial [Streptomyces sp. NPDC096153]|uniref:L-seryl-tRNA(Sec) selenium transferase n=1 Tax=Streptomyces sp. NPDC096153 TaxID=3155548 RepID=UPI003332F869